MNAVNNKNKAEKRRLLTELETRKQREFELLYRLEHEKMKNEKTSAFKNVMEKLMAEERLQELE
jgi:hypothetical protein